jgi:spore maturation protein CgeB
VRVLIVNTDYPTFLDSFYGRNPGLEDRSYADQLARRADEPFGISQFYAANLRALGVDAEVVHANNERMQRAWAREHADDLAALGVPTPSRARAVAARLGARRAAGLVRRVAPAAGAKFGWVEEILTRQVRAYEPDVLVSLDMISLSPLMFARLRATVPLLVGQHGAVALPAGGGLDVFDLLLSSNMPTVEAFRRQGARAEHLQLAFEASLLPRLAERGPRHAVTFIGSFFHGIHDQRTQLVAELSRRFGELEVWAPSVDSLPASSPIHDRYRGPVWGLEMFQVLRDSRLTLNFHGDAVATAANCRLFEATGAGAGLVTDAKPNLHELFDVGGEVLTFDDIAGCIATIERALEAPVETESLAERGQKRTLREHTYRRRMERFLELTEAARATAAGRR